MVYKIMEDIDQKLTKRGLKPTAMRQLVLEKLLTVNHAIALGDLEIELGRADKSTIYRTLKTFEKALLIHSIEDGSGKTKYAICPDYCDCTISELHSHFYCHSCSYTFCLPSSPIPNISVPVGFKVDQANFIVKGICASCRNAVIA